MVIDAFPVQRYQKKAISVKLVYSSGARKEHENQQKIALQAAILHFAMHDTTHLHRRLRRRNIVNYR